MTYRSRRHALPYGDGPVWQPSSFAPPESGELFRTYTCVCGYYERTWAAFLAHRRAYHCKAQRFSLVDHGEVPAVA